MRTTSQAIVAARRVKRPSHLCNTPIGCAAGRALALTLTLAAMAPAGASSFSWLSPVDGSFSDPAKWSPRGGPPGPADTVLFGLGGKYAIDLDRSTTNFLVWLSGGDVTLNLHRTTYTLAATDSALRIALFQSDVGHLTISGGTLDLSTLGAGVMEVGRSGVGTLSALNGAQFISSLASIGTGNGQGTVQIGPGSSSWSNSGTITVGAIGTGSLDVLNGSSVTCGLALVADGPASVGHLNVTGLAAAFNCPGSLLTIGDNGQGALLINGGGVVTAGLTSLGEQPSGVGVATISGPQSLLDSTAIGLTVGNRGQGSLSVQSGASVLAGYLNVGAQSSSEGHVALIGEGSSLSAPDGSISIGGHDLGTLQISSGADATCAFATVAQGLGSTGHATVTDAGSTWQVNGWLDVGRQGAGTLDVRSAGVMSVTGALGLATLNGGSGSAVIDGSGSLCSVGALLTIGRTGSGIVSVSHGGTLACPAAILGDLADSSGQMTVSGSSAPDSPSTWTCADSLTVGKDGLGSLTITAGGRLATGSAIIGDSPLPNAVILSGPGSSWTNDGALIVGNAAGSGALTIAAGASLTSTLGIIGNESSTSSKVSLDGAGSSWIDHSKILVGFNGDGHLTISGGASVQCTTPADSPASLSIGVLPGSDGEVILGGNASTLDATSGSIIVGEGGHGMLTIGAGATVHSTGGRVASAPRAAGEVRITDPGSAWISAAPILVSDPGPATVTVASGGSLSAPALTIGANGTLGGNGVVHAPVLSLGAVKPGLSPGRLSIDGAYTQAAGGRLVIELGGSSPGVSYDVLDVHGPVVLNGTLEVSFVDGFVPASGQSFTIITAATSSGRAPNTRLAPLITGTFQSVVASTTITIAYLTDRVVITTPCGCPGDLNSDCAINGLDLAQFLGSWTGQLPYSPCTPHLAADLNGDCKVNGLDLAFLLGAWGSCH